MPRKKQTIHASGLVEVKVTVGRNMDGKRIQKSFYGTSKLAARSKADEYLTQQAVASQTGQVFIERHYTFGEWANKWLETKRNTVKQSTFDTTYKSKIDKYLIPYFGNSSLQKLNHHRLKPVGSVERLKPPKDHLSQNCRYFFALPNLGF